MATLVTKLDDLESRFPSHQCHQQLTASLSKEGGGPETDENLLFLVLLSHCCSSLSFHVCVSRLLLQKPKWVNPQMED